jgi:hypothetical protein
MLYKCARVIFFVVHCNQISIEESLLPCILIMKKILAPILSIIILFPVFSQRNKIVFLSDNGTTFTKKQVDSLWYASGDWVSLNLRARIPRHIDTILFSITPVTKSHLIKSYRSSGCDKKRLSIAEIKRETFFKDIASIKLTSFKIKPDAEERKIPKANDQVDMNGMFETKTLNEDLKDITMDALANQYKPNQQEWIAFCYEPRNAVVFLDKNEKVIGYVEICFECHGHKIQPEDLKTYIPFTVSFEMMKQIFMAAGIKYGMNEFEEMPEPR